MMTSHQTDRVRVRVPRQLAGRADALTLSSLPALGRGTRVFSARLFASLLLCMVAVLLTGCDDRSDNRSDGQAGGGDSKIDEANRVVDKQLAGGASPILTNGDATHPQAGRAPFPEEGETLTKPLPAKRLSDIDQFAQPIDPDDLPDLVPWEQASQYVGYDITVSGKVVNVGQSRDGKVNFLNFHHDWRGKFYMVLFDDLAKTLDQPVADLFEGKTLHVAGKVTTFNGKPQMEIRSMDQVRFIDE